MTLTKKRIKIFSQKKIELIQEYFTSSGKFSFGAAFKADSHSRVIQLGLDDADDDDNPDGIPVPVQVETGEGSSDAVKDADEKADDHAPKKRIHSSTNAAKIVHV
ncbi:unnamed protein product [Brassica rapa subsp. trilocularis]|uniref:(rape) hypothetical protein n=1 Tax=Brassica napus TaxID=3708 RepID=A0A816VMR4_BRANA|nr:unnamed protein product [Brassica napus]